MSSFAICCVPMCQAHKILKQYLAIKLRLCNSFLHYFGAVIFLSNKCILNQIQVHEVLCLIIIPCSGLRLLHYLVRYKMLTNAIRFIILDSGIMGELHVNNVLLFPCNILVPSLICYWFTLL